MQKGSGPIAQVLMQRGLRVSFKMFQATSSSEVEPWLYRVIETVAAA